MYPSGVPAEPITQWASNIRRPQTGGSSWCHVLTAEGASTIFSHTSSRLSELPNRKKCLATGTDFILYVSYILLWHSSLAFSCRIFLLHDNVKRFCRFSRDLESVRLVFLTIP